MIYRLDRLRHDSVVGRDYEYRDIGRLRAARTHRGERLVTRGVEESDLSVVYLYAICADRLRDAAGLARGHVSVADSVEQRRFAVVDVSHYTDDRTARHEILGFVLRLVEQPLLYRDDDLARYLCSKLVGDKICRVVIDSLVYRRHDAQTHQLLYHLAGRHL